MSDTNEWVFHNDPENYSDTVAHFQINTSVSPCAKNPDEKFIPPRDWFTVIRGVSLHYNYQLSDFFMWKELAEQEGWATRIVLVETTITNYTMDEALNEIRPASAPDQDAWEDHIEKEEAKKE